jgi:farnesyl-diphosphate farnesyltransferase
MICISHFKSEANLSAYSMGLFLQKTNIIRDYREDLDDKRRFWPKEVWSKYATDLGDFADPKNMDAVPSFPDILNRRR